MNREVLFLSVSVFVAITVSSETYACGESLYRVGRGVSYRVYSAPVPANILIFVESLQSKSMAEKLELAGHKVKVIDITGDIDTKLNYAQYDVIIGPFNAREPLEENVEFIENRPTFMPVISTDEQKDLRKESGYKYFLSEDDDTKKHLKTIHQSLKDKGA